MKTILISICCAILILVFFGCEKPGSNIPAALQASYPEHFAITVANSSEQQRIDAVVTLSIIDILEKYNDFNAAAFVVFDKTSEAPAQAIDIDADGQFDKIMLVTDFLPGEKKSLTVGYAKTGELRREYPKRTQAELSHKFGGHFENRKYIGGEFRNVDYLRVPPEHTDHSFFIRYEGPGWESDKVGYRFYLDWRNANDVFGKKAPGMVLQNVGLDGFDSYHEMSDWGADILKVGESLGIGSIGMWYDNKVFRVAMTDSSACRIAANGPVYSQIKTEYFGWQVGDKKYDLISDLSITAGSRLTKNELQITGDATNICTGIVKLDKGRLLEQTGGQGEWTYLATYGQQTLFDDDLGMAVLYKKSDFVEIKEDKESHIVVLKPVDGKLKYYFLAAWQKEPGGIQTESELTAYLEKVIAELNSPLKLQL